MRQISSNYDLNKSFEILKIPVKEYGVPTISQLNKGADYINKVINNNKKIYIHCREGISRAPTFLVAYFIKYRKYDIKNSIEIIISKRNFINILDNQLLVLKKFEKSIKDISK